VTALGRIAPDAAVAVAVIALLTGFIA